MVLLPDGVTLRFIPTGVGNTSSSCIFITGSSVHPHGRGEHMRESNCGRRCRGSSPRAWGTRSSLVKRLASIRFIPTGVGNTSTHSYINLLVSVHPHGRGEHLKIYQLVLFYNGSSPRAWGTPASIILSACVNRFIPTGVGNTALLSLSFSANAVHPHGRGEHGKNAIIND